MPPFAVASVVNDIVKDMFIVTKFAVLLILKAAFGDSKKLKIIGLDDLGRFYITKNI